MKYDKNTGEEPSIDEVLERAKEAVSIPYVYGHGDVGLVLVRLLQGDYSYDEALEEIGCLIEDYTNTV